jgi:hypothetical protein
VSTRTTTKVARYCVQRQRRAEFIKTWRANQRTISLTRNLHSSDDDKMLSMRLL